MNDNYPPGHQALTTVRGYVQRMVERMHDKRLHFFEFDLQKMEDGIGASWHPNVTTDTKMGEKLAASLKRDVYK